jgi:hypothetical protein
MQCDVGDAEVRRDGIGGARGTATGSGKEISVGSVGHFESTSSRLTRSGSMGQVECSGFTLGRAHGAAGRAG